MPASFSSLLDFDVVAFYFNFLIFSFSFSFRSTNLRALSNPLLTLDFEMLKNYFFERISAHTQYSQCVNIVKVFFSSWKETTLPIFSGGVVVEVHLIQSRPLRTLQPQLSTKILRPSRLF